MASDSQITNTLGAQVVTDGEVPRTFTAKAREVISGGFLVQVSGASGDVGSQISSFADGDLKVIGAQDIRLCNGMALNNAGSNELVTIARRGDYLMNAGEIVSGGALVGHNGSGGIANILNTGSVPLTTMGPTPIGRAQTTSASGTSNYALVGLNL